MLQKRSQGLAFVSETTPRRFREADGLRSGVWLMASGLLANRRENR
jgi:hypothetical protein